MTKKNFAIRRFLVRLKNLINLNRGTDHTDISGTLKTIIDSIQIRGANIWILICGSLLASIGLDTNSATLLIGAMLISPLMIPILGIGVFYATRDMVNLRRSSQKMFIAVGVSLVCSLIYFLITPFGELTPEINSRTHPTLIDAIIAFIGGVVGIISITRKEQVTVLPGVAVSITLMPPICVMGYAISQWDLSIFAGAFYLLLINALIIVFVSSFAAKSLGFPVKKNVSLKKRKLQQSLAIIGIIVLLSPGTYLLNRLVHENNNKEKIQQYIENSVEPVTKVLKWNYNKTDSTDEVEIFLMEDILSKDSVYCLTETFDEIGLEGTKLSFIQPQVKEEIVEVFDSLSNHKKIKDSMSENFQEEIKSIFPEVASITMVNGNDKHKTLMVEWTGLDLLVPHKKRKLEGIERYLELNYQSDVTLIQ